MAPQTLPSLLLPVSFRKAVAESKLCWDLLKPKIEAGFVDLPQWTAPYGPMQGQPMLTEPLARFLSAELMGGKVAVPAGELVCGNGAGKKRCKSKGQLAQGQLVSARVCARLVVDLLGRAAFAARRPLLARPSVLVGLDPRERQLCGRVDRISQARAFVTRRHRLRVHQPARSGHVPPQHTHKPTPLRQAHAAKGAELGAGPAASAACTSAACASAAAGASAAAAEPRGLRKLSPLPPKGVGAGLNAAQRGFVPLSGAEL